MKIWKGRSSITITATSDTGTPVPIYGNLGLPASSGVMGELLITIDIGAEHLMASSAAVLIFASQLL
jgi:hypothetical protein